MLLTAIDTLPLDKRYMLYALRRKMLILRYAMARLRAIVIDAVATLLRRSSAAERHAAQLLAKIIFSLLYAEVGMLLPCFATMPPLLMPLRYLRAYFCYYAQLCYD